MLQDKIYLLFRIAVLLSVEHEIPHNPCLLPTYLYCFYYYLDVKEAELVGKTVWPWIFQQLVGIPIGTNCAPLLADILLYSYDTEFIQSLLSTGRKQMTSRFNFTYRYIDDVLSINNPEFENYLGQMYPVELERATLLLLTWIYFCRSGGTVNFTLPLMTNVTISISTSQIFRSWVAIFQPCPPMASLFRSLCPGLLLVWMFYPEGDATFK